MSALLEGVLQEVHQTILRMLERTRREGSQPRSLLDVGCWDGEHTERYARALGCAAFGVEFFAARAREAEARGVTVARLDLETGVFPWPDGSMDVVVSNQVFEHLKNVWRPMSEIYRVLLALGRQPTSIRTLGPHVRGYTFGEIQRFVALDGGFRIVRATAAGFYPFPVPLANPIARVWPGAGHTTVLLARREGGAAEPPWVAWYRREREAGLQSTFD